MRPHTTFILKIGLLLALLISQAFSFEYVLEKVFVKNPLLVKREIALSVEKNNQELKVDLYELKNNITLNTIKFSLNILKNKDIADMYYKFNQDVLSRLEKDIKENDEDANELKEYLKKANLILELQNNSFETALSSYKRYTKNEYVQSNLLDVINLIQNPKNTSDALKDFNKQVDEIKKAILKTFVVDDINPQIEAYYKELGEYKFAKKETFLKKQALLKELGKQSKLLDFLKVQTQIKEIDKKLIELTYSLLFQKCKISFITGNLLKDVKKQTPLKPKKVVSSTKPIAKTVATTTKSKVAMSKPSKKSLYKLTKPNPFHHTKLKRIHFVGNMADVSSYSIYIVARNAELLKQMKDYELELYGYTDNLGTSEENYNLGLQRAIKTKEALVAFGANPDKIKVFSKSDSNPIATNKTKKGRLLNRRVEFKLIKGK